MKANHALLNELAEAQHSVFTGTQAIDRGFTRRQIRTLRENGIWIPLQRDLYRLGGRPFDLRAQLSAAVQSLPSAVVSHRSAAVLHRMPGVIETDVQAEVTTSETSSRSQFATVHRYAGIAEDDVVLVERLPVTAPALTVFHLAIDLGEHELGALIDECVARRMLEMSDLFALADFWTRIGRPRRQVMRRVLRLRSSGGAAESALEAAFLDLVAAHELPIPVSQYRPSWLAWKDGRVDFAYPELQLAIELDGRAWHTREADFARDRERDRAAQLAGWRVLRYTWDEVTRRPRQVAAELRAISSRPALTA